MDFVNFTYFDIKMKGLSQLKSNSKGKLTKPIFKKFGFNQEKKRNNSSDFKILQKESDYKVNLFGNTQNISLLVI